MSNLHYDSPSQSLDKPHLVKRPHEYSRVDYFFRGAGWVEEVPSSEAGDRVAGRFDGVLGGLLNPNDLSGGIATRARHSGNPKRRHVALDEFESL